MSGPAPGLYSPKPIKKFKAYTFGKSKAVRFRKPKCFGLAPHSPGPGSYCHKSRSAFTGGRSAGWGRSKASRFGKVVCVGMCAPDPIRRKRRTKRPVSVSKYNFAGPTKSHLIRVDSLTMERQNSLTIVERKNRLSHRQRKQRQRSVPKPALANKRPTLKKRKVVSPKPGPGLVKTKKNRTPKSTIKKREPTVILVTPPETRSPSVRQEEASELSVPETPAESPLQKLIDEEETRSQRRARIMRAGLAATTPRESCATGDDVSGESEYTDNSEETESGEESEETGAEEEVSEDAESNAEESEEASEEADEASEEESEEADEASEEKSEKAEEESEEASASGWGSGSDCDDVSDMDSILALIASHGL